VIVSEETGSISVAHAGRIIRRLDPERLENVLSAFYKPEKISLNPSNLLQRIFPGRFHKAEKDR
jgi:diadenylate cyclase